MIRRPISRAQARFLKDGCSRCGHMRSSHIGNFSSPSCGSCAKSYPQGARHAFENKTYEEISGYEAAGYTRDEATDMLEAE